MNPRSPRARASGAMAVLLLLLPLMASCRATTPPDTAVAESSHHDGIPWFEGTVEEAFVKAEAEQRPVFLYWGAIWCPPCHVLKTKVFTRPEFQARLAETVPVYLDGDTERAQLWGDKLQTAGYPTVIVFDAGGREVMRLNSLISIEQYTETLTAALDATRPIGEVIAQLETEGVASLSAAELNLLAFYSWFQDKALDLDLAGRRALFGRLWRETPDERRIEKARFLMLYADSASESRGETEPAELEADEMAVIETGVRAVLADRALRITNLDVVVYGAGTAAWLAPEPGAARDDLVAAWAAAAIAVEQDEELTAWERVGALYAGIRLERLGVPADSEDDPPPLSAELQQRIRDRIRWAGETVTDEDELQGVMNTMAGVLETAGLADEAKTLLSDKVAQTIAPYYFVSWLAYLEEDAGNIDEAVRLYREAWQGARAAGSETGMTPFRWGSTYLRKAMSLTPDARKTITADGATILGDVLATPDAFAHSNWSRMQSLDAALDRWSEEDALNTTAIDALRGQILSACGSFPDAGEDSAGERCLSLVDEEAAA
jgi:thioredoxin-related protein